MNDRFWELWFFADCLMFKQKDRELCGISDLMRGADTVVNGSKRTGKSEQDGTKED